MAWLELTIHTASGGIESVAAALTAAGFDDLLIEDQAEYEAFLEQNRAYWDYVDEAFQNSMQNLSRIRLYLDAADDSGLRRLRTLLQRLKQSDPDGSLGSLKLDTAPLPDTDWEQSWKDNYPPLRVGERLLILPYWLSDADTGGRMPVILNPGLTFGTGAHPSTRMVLERLEQGVFSGCRCIDLGSGSGILSIAALRLGAASAVGVDIDPKAEDIARENAAYNGFFEPEFTACTGNVTTDRALMARLAGQYDVVLVNIVADVIVQLAPVLPRFLGAGSRLILSGILDTRLSEVEAALVAAGLRVTGRYAQEDWRCLTAERRIP